MQKQFMLIQFDWIEDKNYRRVMCSCKGIQLVYDILRRYVIRDRLKHKVARYIFDNYYSKGVLASSVTYNYLIERTGLSSTTIAKCIANLKEAGYIEVQDAPSDIGETQNIYLLGKRKVYTNEDGNEVACDYWKIDDLVSDNLFNARILCEDFKK